MVGDAIIKFATAVEESAEDSEATIIGASNLLYAEISLGVAVVTGGTGAILMSAAGLIGTFVGKAQDSAKRHKEEVDATTAATLDITTKDGKKAAQGLEPEDLMPEFPENVRGWEVGP